MATMPGLRPLGLGEILDVGIKLYLRNWRPLILCVVWLVLPVQILTVLIVTSVSSDALDPTAAGDPVASGEETEFLAAQGISALLSGFVYLIATAACFKALADAYLGTEPAAGRSLRFAVRRLPKLLALVALFLLASAALGGAAFAGGPAVLGLLVLVLFVPMIWLAIAWSLTIPAMLFEDAGPIRGLNRSFQLVKGHWWRILGTLLVGVVLVSFLAAIVQGILVIVPAVAAPDNDLVLAVATVVAGTLGAVLTTPFTAAVVALLYFDQRVRKEGFDLQLLAEGLGGSPGPSAGVPVVVGPQAPSPAPAGPPPPQPEPSGGWQPPRPPSWPPERSSGGL